ncbi:ComEC family competence protein [Patescibacteria group bacterium]|nr:ComEC family competence protein [Patescibacteria group bacterium]MBU4512701.1 ComEC family competence protein [Patescibacteria group bacterium]MCG2693603.1 ComEC family competence protein [Candidatus Parcubacteria bacterium]
MKKSQIFLYSCLAFIVGIALGSFIEVQFFIIFMILVLGAVVFGFTLKDKKWRVLGLVVIFFVLGLLRCDFGGSDNNSRVDTNDTNEMTTFVGIVADEPDQRIDHAKLTIKPRGEDISGKVLVKTDLYPEYNYGDELEISCKLETPGMVEDFNYGRYLAMNGIYSVCYNPDIKLLSQGKESSAYAGILKLKYRLKQVVERGISEPGSAIFAAMFLGARRGISQELLDKFSRVGVSHVIAISGLHITIISTILMSVLIGFGLWRKQAFWIASVFLSLYIIMIGAPASAVRAGIMGFLLLLAMNLGRLNKSLNALLFAACLMLLVNPKILRSDVGFQLSFLAVLGIIYFSPWFEKIFKKIPKKFGLRQSLVMTMSAQVMTLPLIAYQFNRVSIIAPLVNILVLPILPFVLIFGAVATVLGLAWTGLAKVLFIPVWLLLGYLVKVVDVFSGLNFAGVEIEKVSVWVIGLFYLGIGVMIWRMKKIINN